MRSLVNTLFFLVLIAASTAALRLASSPVSDTFAGVTVFDREKIAPGYTLYNSTRKPFAALIDLKGKEVHRWQIQQVIPNKGFHHIEPLAKGEILAISTDRALFKLGFNSEVLWKTPGNFHHDLKVLDSGEIYTLTREKRSVFKNRLSTPVLDDCISILDADGRISKKVSLYDILAPIVPDSILRRARQFAVEEEQEISPDTPADILHTNSLDVLERDLPYAPAGAVLVSVRGLNTIAIIDIDNEHLLWHWGPGELEAQHDASFQQDGSILIFDNGVDRERSRVLAVNPVTDNVSWEYGHKRGQKFFSEVRGGVQRLSNGNYLVTNAVRDAAFEITPAGEKVWRIRLVKIDKKAKHTLYRMRRIAPDNTFLRDAGGSSILPVYPPRS